MTKESRFALLGLWSVVKWIAISAGIAYIIGAKTTDILACVAIWHIWADRIMAEERRAAEKRGEGIEMSNPKPAKLNIALKGTEPCTRVTEKDADDVGEYIMISVSPGQGLRNWLLKKGVNARYDFTDEEPK